MASNVLFFEGNTVDLNEIINGMVSQVSQLQLQATVLVRKVLAQPEPPIDAIIDAGIVPKLVLCLSFDHLQELQYEAAGVLMNITTGTSIQTTKVVDAGAVKEFVRLLSSPHLNITELAVCTLGNIADKGPELRNYVLAEGAAKPLLELAITPEIPIPFLRSVTRTIASLCQNKNPPHCFVKQCLPILTDLIFNEDKEVVSSTCLAFLCVMDGSTDNIREVVDAGVIPRLVELLTSPDVTVQSHALRALGNVATGNDQQTQIVIDAGALAFLPSLLAHDSPEVRKEAAWFLSNVTAGNVQQIQAVIDAGLIGPLKDLLDKGDIEAKREGAFAVANYASGAKAEQIASLVMQGMIPSLCALFSVWNEKTVEFALHALYYIFSVVSFVVAPLVAIGSSCLIWFLGYERFLDICS